MVIAPDGTQYVGAQVNERADLIVDHTKGRFKELGLSRWRKLETSSIGRKATKEALDQANGAEAHTAKRAARKARRKGRKKMRKTKTA